MASVRVVLAVVVLWGAACARGDACLEGEGRCDGNVLETCVEGAYRVVEACPLACDGQLGCVACAPGTGTCMGEWSESCRDDGTGYDLVHCDPVQGMSCSEDTGRCVGACAPDELESPYLGCEYFPTITAQAGTWSFPFGVSVTNAADREIDLVVEGGALAEPVRRTVPAGAAVAVELPWVTALKMCESSHEPDGLQCRRAYGGSLRVRGGAYRLRTTGPAIAVQHSPLRYEHGDAISQSNDASLLIPRRTLGQRYATATLANWGPESFPGVVAVTAVEDDTTVTLMPRAATAAGEELPALQPSQELEVVLDQGDVVQLASAGGDLTGSLVEADRPVQVIGAHFCTYHPENLSACDHIEEAFLPASALGTEYLVGAPAHPIEGTSDVTTVRIVALERSTMLESDPMIPWWPVELAEPGDVIEVTAPASFRIRSDKPVLVVQYLRGHGAGTPARGRGDPSMVALVPTNAYRSEYYFFAPPDYESSHVTIVAPPNSGVEVDGVSVTDFYAIGSSGYETARVELSVDTPGGVHHAAAFQPFGLIVYGYGIASSYAYAPALEQPLEVP